MNRYQWKLASPVRNLYLVASDEGLENLGWQKLDVPYAKSLEGEEAAIRHLAETVRQLGEYFAGARREFALTLSPTGSAFQKKVWAELARIPYGETRAYRDIALKVASHAGAARAVGTANGRNPIAIVVPCHRVIAADGTLGGFGGGLPAKRTLLTLEGARFREQTSLF